MHQKAIYYILYKAERTPSSVRSLFSKGTGLWREGACCVHVCICLSVCKLMNQLAGQGNP